MRLLRQGHATCRASASDPKRTSVSTLSSLATGLGRRIASRTRPPQDPATLGGTPTIPCAVGKSWNRTQKPRRHLGPPSALAVGIGIAR